MILFLDFDGVTHPEPWEDKDIFCRLPAIEAILREHPQVEVVVSSAWRLTWKYEEECLPQMRQHFSHDIAERVIGVTPDHRYMERSSAPDGLGEYLREWECITWLRKNREQGTPWMALDDRDWWFRPDSAHVMIVDCTTGFLPEHEEEFRRRLGDLELRPSLLKPSPSPANSPNKRGGVK